MDDLTNNLTIFGTGKRKNVLIKYMYCYRRGFSISQVAYPCKKLINGQKSDKMRHSYSCQSRIIYKENSSGAVNVIDDSTHYSHSDKISLLNLTKKERAVISV